MERVNEVYNQALIGLEVLYDHALESNGALESLTAAADTICRRAAVWSTVLKPS